MGSAAGSVCALNATICPPAKAGILQCNFATARRSPARSGAVAFSTYQPAIAIILWPSISPVALLSRTLTEMFFQIGAESFGPLVERVFHCVGDDGCGADNAGRGSRCSHVLGHSKACLVGLSQSQQLCPLLGAPRSPSHHARRRLYAAPQYLQKLTTNQ